MKRIENLDQGNTTVIPASKATLLALAKSPNATIQLAKQQQESVRDINECAQRVCADER